MKHRRAKDKHSSRRLGVELVGFRNPDRTRGKLTEEECGPELDELLLKVPHLLKRSSSYKTKLRFGSMSLS